MSLLTAAVAFDLPHLGASQSDGQAPLLDDAESCAGSGFVRSCGEEHEKNWKNGASMATRWLRRPPDDR
jgi:hypothetical protein